MTYEMNEMESILYNICIAINVNFIWNSNKGNFDIIVR